MRVRYTLMCSNHCHCFSFFFNGSDLPRDLHSFPTRRSSDLEWKCDCARGSDCPGGFCFGRRRDDYSSHLSCLQDRKSTRLNSSHLGISYAVFCLKKKKLPPAQMA